MHGYSLVEKSETGQRIEDVFSTAEHIFEQTFSTAREFQGFIEPRACVLWIDDLDRVRIVCTNKSPAALRQQLAAALGLPESQIVELLGWDRSKFDFTLKEDDALDIKLGNLKPRCAALEYRPPSDAEKAAAAEMRRMIGEDFGKTIERPGEDLFAFVKDLSESRYLPARDPAGKAGGDEIDLSRGWGISGPASLDAAAVRFAAYMKSAMNAEIKAGPGQKNIRLEVTPGLEGGREAFRIQVNRDELRISANDEAGVLQAIYQLQDRMEEREGPFLRTETVERKSVWNPRYLYSYFALYGDPLIQPELDPFPDAYLEKLARCGINGVWISALVRRAAFQPAAVIDVFPLAVFADHDKVDFGRPLAGEHAFHARIELARADTSILIERLPDFHERRERNVVRNEIRPADGA